MATRVLVAPLVLAALVLGAVGVARADAGPAPDASAVAFELLPPRIRGPASVAGLAWTSGSDPPRETEVVAAESAEGSGGDWIEVEYTLDPELDARVAQILSDAGVALGHVILMDPATGEVFAYVSTDPRAFPAIRTYPTASLMKVVTAAAVLRNAPQAASKSCRYLGSPYVVGPASLDAPAVGGSFSSFAGALAISNNQCFARFAVRDVGREALLTEMFRAGIFDAPAPRHPAGRIEAVEDDLELAQLGSGLAGSFITPLSAARLASLLAAGKLVRPYWIARMRDAHGDPLPVPGHQAALPVWPEEVASELRELMVGVTVGGTARNAFRDDDGRPLLGPVRVSGKTGTLSGSDPEGRYHWFIGVAPAERPRIAVASLVVSEPVEGSAEGSAPEAASRRAASAAQVAAAALREVFCDGSGCRPEVVERLHARARARDAAALREREARELAAFREQSELDAPPRPVRVTPLEFPRELRRKPVKGEVVVLLDLDRDGEVLDARIDSSDLPDFDEFVLAEVAGWRFTPPTYRGRPVRATARLPIPIAIE